MSDKVHGIAEELRAFREGIRPNVSQLPLDVGKVVEDIHQHLFHPELSVATSRRRCSLGNNNISTRFRRYFDVGIREYIERWRIDAACQLLRRLDVEIYLVAQAVGYEHPETFSRAFRRQRGRAPSKYRAEQRLQRGAGSAEPSLTPDSEYR